MDVSHHDVRAALNAAAGSQPVSRLGYFTAPVRPATGPLAGYVIKAYRHVKHPAVLERLRAAHDDYVAALMQAGVILPQTHFMVIEAWEGARPVILQEALPEETMLRIRVADDDVATVGDHLTRAAAAINGFWDAAPADTRIGFHPSLRNYALVDGQIVFFDTFPPLIHYSRDEMGKLLLAFSDSRLMRRFGPLMRGKVTAIQDEWYSRVGNLVGMYGSAVRLRPDDREAILDHGRAVARALRDPDRTQMLAELDAPPRLPGYWTTARRALGLEGAPNT